MGENSIRIFFGLFLIKISFSPDNTLYSNPSTSIFIRLIGNKISIDILEKINSYGYIIKDIGDGEKDVSILKKDFTSFIKNLNENGHGQTNLVCYLN